MARRFQDLTGSTFGQLMVVRFDGVDAHQKAQWLCRCTCGATKRVLANNLRRGLTASCGCLHRMQLRARVRKHGESVPAGNTPEYRTWCSVLRRCYNPKVLGYKNYGGRGITVCDRWKSSYENFLGDMGRRPSAKHSLERENNDGHYDPGNCVWATRIEQNNNRRSSHRITYKGVTRTAAEWLRSGELSQTVVNRLRRGWSGADALALPRGACRQPKRTCGRTTTL